MEIKNLRKEKKASPEELAKLMCVSLQAYYKYENETNEPNIENLIKLADYYNVSLDYLVGRERKGDVGYLTPAQLTAVKVIQRLNQQNLLLLTGRAMAMLEAQGE